MEIEKNVKILIGVLTLVLLIALIVTGVFVYNAYRYSKENPLITTLAVHVWYDVFLFTFVS